MVYWQKFNPAEFESDSVMLNFLTNRPQRRTTSVCFCTLAIREPYRRRARRLFESAPELNWVVLTDEPEDFDGCQVRAVHHEPTGPMADEFLKLGWTANGSGRPAYHDKRFVLQAALGESETAIFVDADTRMHSVPKLPAFRPGIAVVRDVDASIAEHLSRYGPNRLPAFEALSMHLTGAAETLKQARWCSEALISITKDGNESKFFGAWEQSAEFLHKRNMFSGEGGVIGLAAFCAGWAVDYKPLSKLAAATRHEGLGPKAI